jgi:hypothetical protein
VFKKGYNRDAGEGHRCIFYDACKPLPPLQQAVGDIGYKLYAYDIESAITRHTTRLEVRYQIVDGKYVTTPLGRPIEIITDQGVAIHTVNMVVVQNVFDLTEKKIFTGEHALTDFLVHMITTNGGENICVAHNGSGYDTRLVFAGLEKLKLQSHLEYKIKRSDCCNQSKLGR